MSERWERWTAWWPYGKGNHPNRIVTEYGTVDDAGLFVPEEAYFKVSESAASRREISLEEAAEYRREAFRCSEGGTGTKKIE